MKVVAINVAPQYNSLDEWRAFLQVFGAADFVWAQDTYDQRAVQAYNIQSVGVTVLIDRQGQIIYRDERASTYEMLYDGLLPALN